MQTKTTQKPQAPRTALAEINGLLKRPLAAVDDLTEEVMAEVVLQRNQEQAIYRFPIRTKQGTKQITGISVEGATDLYRLCLMRGWVPAIMADVDGVKFNVSPDAEQVIALVKHQVTERGGQTWGFVAAGWAYLYLLNPDTKEKKLQDHAHTIALSKATRNAMLRVLPAKVKKAFKAYCLKTLGHTVEMGEGERSESGEEFLDRVTTAEGQPQDPMVAEAFAIAGALDFSRDEADRIAAMLQGGAVEALKINRLSMLLDKLRLAQRDPAVLEDLRRGLRQRGAKKGVDTEPMF